MIQASVLVLLSTSEVNWCNEGCRGKGKGEGEGREGRGSDVAYRQELARLTHDHTHARTLLFTTLSCTQEWTTHLHGLLWQQGIWYSLHIKTVTQIGAYKQYKQGPTSHNTSIMQYAYNELPAFCVQQTVPTANLARTGTVCIDTECNDLQHRETCTSGRVGQGSLRDKTGWVACWYTLAHLLVSSM